MKTQWKKALSVLTQITKGRTTIPILDCFALEVTGGMAKLTATNMDQSAEITLETNLPDMALCLNAEAFAGFVAKSDADFTLEQTGQGQVTYRSGRFEAIIPCLPISDFPQVSLVDAPARDVVVEQLCASNWAASAEGTRYYLTGTCLDNNQVIATDGHRLVVNTCEGLDSEGHEPVILPTPFIQAIAKSFEGSVSLQLTKTLARVSQGNLAIVSKLIDGTYPDWRQVVPSQAGRLLCEIDAKALRDAVGRVSVVASDRTRVVKLTMALGKMEIASNSAEFGSASETIDVAMDGQCEAGFNAKYLEAAIDNYPGDAFPIWFDGAKPAIIGDTTDGSFQVLMPMRV